MLEIAAWATGVVLSLTFVFQHIRVEWPESYYGPVESVAQFVSLSASRFAVFRLGPPFIAFLLVASYASNPTAAVWVTCAAYTAISTLLSIRSSKVEERGSVQLTCARVLVLVTIGLGLVATAWVATMLAPKLIARLPSLSSVLSDMIAATFTAVIVIVYLRTISPLANGTHWNNSRVNLDEQTSSAVKAIALENLVEPQLALAIAYVENAQRPAWFRRFERRISWLNRKGSFGLFQVRGQGVVSDLESCRIGLARLKGSFPVLATYGHAASWSVKQLAEAHNPDARFAEAVSQAYFPLAQFDRKASGESAPDRRPVLSVSQVGRFAARMRVRGTAWMSESGSISIVCFTADGQLVASVNPTIVRAEGLRVAWFADVPSGSVNLEVRMDSPVDDGALSEPLHLDLSETEVERDISLRMP